MKDETPYIIKYSNHLIFEGRTLAFRKRELFDITDIPTHIPFTGTHWNVKRKQLSPAKAKELLKNQPIEKDVTSAQWYIQEQLNHVFNL